MTRLSLVFLRAGLLDGSPFFDCLTKYGDCSEYNAGNWPDDPGMFPVCGGETPEEIDGSDKKPIDPGDRVDDFAALFSRCLIFFLLEQYFYAFKRHSADNKARDGNADQ